MSDHIAATIAGASTAAIGKMIEMIHGKQSVNAIIIKTFDIAITGFCFAFFLVPNISIVIDHYLGLTIGLGGLYFLVSHYGVPIRNGIGSALSKLFKLRFS